MSPVERRAWMAKTNTKVKGGARVRATDGSLPEGQEEEEVRQGGHSRVVMTICCIIRHDYMLYHPSHREAERSEGINLLFLPPTRGH